MFNISIKTGMGEDVYRVVFSMREEKFHRKPHRVVVCRILYKETKQLRFYGESVCSLKDNFDKNKGRKIALTRALKNSPFDYTQRGRFWKAYFDTRHGKH